MKSCFENGRNLLLREAFKVRDHGPLPTLRRALYP